MAGAEQLFANGTHAVGDDERKVNEPNDLLPQASVSTADSELMRVSTRFTLSSRFSPP